MGKQKLGDFIRKIDYLKAKSGNDYADSSENPGNQLLEFERGCDDISFDELKDGFLAFEEKVCIKGFPERHSPAYWVAYSTMCVLNRLTSSFVSDHEEMESRMAEVQLHTLVALMKAGPGTTHCEMMDKLIGTDTKEYAKTLGVKELAPIMEAAKVTFKYIPNDDCDERVYGTLQHGSLRSFFQMFSEEQYKLAQKEILDVYLHCASQIPTLTEKYAQQIYYTVRDMIDNFEDDNPYLGLKDTNIFKRHMKAIQDMVYSESYAPKTPTEDIAEKMLRNLVRAILKGGIVVNVFEDMVNFIAEISKNSDARKKAKEIYDIYRCTFFRNMEENKVQIVKIFRSCCALTNTVLSQEEVTHDAVVMIDDAIDAVIKKSKPLAAEDVKEALTMVKTLLGSGRKVLIRQGEDVLEHTKKIKALDWKKHTETAAQMFDIIAKIPKEQMQDDDKARLDDTVRAYLSFSKTFLGQLKKGKVLQQLQANLVKFCFDNLVTSSPVKTEIAEECSGRDFLDFSKHEKLRLQVLQRSENLLKNTDLPWEDRDLGTTVSNMLRTVVESYDENGKAVTKEENAVLMSIFNIISEGGESVVDHFYEEENEEIPNVKMKIWQNVVMEYTRVHQSTGTLACISPFMPEVLRWSKIALEDDHEDMMHLCFGILNWVGLSTPIELKSCLPDIMSLMIESGRCNELYSLVNALYPHNPGAVHDRLQDLFDGLDNLKDHERHVVTAFFQTISTKHPEAFTKKQISMMFDMYKKGNEAGKPLLLIIIRAIAEKYPKNLVDFFPQLCDSKMFKPESMNLRSGILVCIGGVNEQLGQKTVDYLMKYADHADPTTSHIVVGTVSTLVRKHKDYMQKYRPKLVKLEKISTVPAVRDLAHDMILVLDGLSVESIAEDLQQQQEDITELDTKVDATIDTVVTIGDKVIEHDKEIGELGEGLKRVEERVDDVEEDLGETKIKVEEVNNKTMTNAPKWSRDLTKLMNPTAENDWRLLASRLGYCNDDIRSWAQQHDPCMALLSEWYATHKISEASFGVLTALTEMNRMDGVAILENAMKTAEGVVEDEEFEYPSPPPVFISYQWGFQNEVKLLKQHLNMAGYECWLDVGQMGGGDKLFAKIDNGIRGAKVVICCVTEKYAKSPNCNREVNLSVNLNKPIIPLLMEKMDWPPVGSMGPIFSEYLFIRFFQRCGEETKEKDQRYWPIPKFQELLMQLNFFVVPDQKMAKKEYANWWAPIIEEIVVDKTKGKKQTNSQKTKQKDAQVVESDASPQIFLSYQWGKQPQIMALYKRLTSLGYTVWMDIYQMGGGDSLYDKIDRGMRGCKAVVSCVTLKYSLSANCRREISLADALKKPIIPLLLEQMKWPPDGPMSMVFTELLFINFYRDESMQTTWTGDKFDELTSKLGQHLPVTDTSTDKNDNMFKGKSQTNSSVVNKTVVTKSAAKKAIESPTSKGKSPQGNEAANNLKKPDSARNDVGLEESINDAKKGIQNDKNDTDKPPSVGDTKVQTKDPPARSLNNSPSSSKAKQPPANTKTAAGHNEAVKMSNSQPNQCDNGTTNNGKTESKCVDAGNPQKVNDKQVEKEKVVAETVADKNSKTQQNNGTSGKNERVNDQTQSNQDAKSKSCTIL